MRQIIKGKIKIVMDALQSAYVPFARLTGSIDFPVPPNSSLRKTSSQTIRHYYISGIRCYLPIVTIALHRGIRLDDQIRILDFGCGVGRELLHFTKYYPNPLYFACDVDFTSVAVKAGVKVGQCGGVKVSQWR